MQCGVAVEDQERNDLVQTKLQVGLCRLCWLNFECSRIREFYWHNKIIGVLRYGIRLAFGHLGDPQALSPSFGI